MKTERCQKCNAILFEARPFQTSQQEIVEFARNSSLPEHDKQSIIQSKWIHPGIYCPRGCTTILIETPIQLPRLTTSESIAIVADYSQRHCQEFQQTHGATSRIVACVHCAKFLGAIVYGNSPTARYRNPKYRPLSNSKVKSAHCADTRIQALDRAWWYDQGQDKPECDYFEYDQRLFKRVYKEITGWSEYFDSSNEE